MVLRFFMGDVDGDGPDDILIDQLLRIRPMTLEVFNFEGFYCNSCGYREFADYIFGDT